jgi:hypothetical protein
MTSHTTEQAKPLYRDSSKSIDERVSDLLNRMTLAENAGQLFHSMLLPSSEGSLAPAVPNFDIHDTKSLLFAKFSKPFQSAWPDSQLLNDCQMAKFPSRICSYSYPLGNTDYHFLLSLRKASSGLYSWVSRKHGPELKQRLDND